MELNPDQDVLRETLAAAVPILAMQLQALPEPQRHRVMRRWAEASADLIAPFSDKLLARRDIARRGHTAACRRNGNDVAQSCDCLIGTSEVWAALARGLTVAAMAPGGVHLFGAHWQIDGDPHTYERTPR